MPAIEQAWLNNKAVLWEAINNGKSFDNNGGYIVSDTPEEIPVRWEHGIKEMFNPQGTPIVVTSTVLLPREIPVGSVLFEGVLNEYNSDNTDTELMQIVAREIIPDIKGTSVLYEAGCIRYAGTIPTTGILT